jgi:16S rRNA processing protein RimM
VPAEPFTGITLALILRPHGLRGEVSAAILTDFPERLPRLGEVWLNDGQTPPRCVQVKRCRLSTAGGGQAIFHFAGVEDRNAAERLRGLEVQIPLERRAQLGEGSYYVADLVGCEIWETDASAALGVVRNVEFFGGAPLLAVDTPAGELLVPLAAEICYRIDVTAKRITVALPEGLRDLNGS